MQMQDSLSPGALFWQGRSQVRIWLAEERTQWIDSRELSASKLIKSGVADLATLNLNN